MARKPRVHFDGALYHVIVRGNNQDYIFKEEEWKEQYFETVKRYQKRYGFKVYAYAIMDNHAHLLIEVNHVKLSKLMQCIQQVFTQSYNRAHNRTGHVFEQRYKAILCDKDEYLLMLIRYIHQNPVRIGKKEGLGYRWSSFTEYIDPKVNELVTISFPLSLFDNRIDHFVEFMNVREEEIPSKNVRDFSEHIDEYEEQRRQNNQECTLSLNEIVKKVCGYLGIDEALLGDKSRSKELVRARELIAYMAELNPSIKQREVAVLFKRKANAVSMMVSKEGIEERLAETVEKILMFGA